MIAQAENFKIELTYNELWSIAFNVKASLIFTLKDHWVNHQNSWEENEKERMVILKDLFYALGRPDIFDGIKEVADDIFKEFNKKRGS